MFKQLHQELHAIQAACKRLDAILESLPCYHVNLSLGETTMTRPGPDGEPVEQTLEAIICDDCDTAELPEVVIERGWKELE